MPKFTAVDVETGRVLFSGDAADPVGLQSETTRVWVGEKYDGGWLDADGVHHLVPVEPAPIGGHQWDWSAKAWLAVPVDPTAAKLLARQRVLAQLGAAESGQLRPMREIETARLRGEAPPADAVERLHAINAAVDSLRAQLRDLA